MAPHQRLSMIHLHRSSRNAVWGRDGGIPFCSGPLAREPQSYAVEARVRSGAGTETRRLHLRQHKATDQNGVAPETHFSTSSRHTESCNSQNGGQRDSVSRRRYRKACSSLFVWVNVLRKRQRQLFRTGFFADCATPPTCDLSPSTRNEVQSFCHSSFACFSPVWEQARNCGKKPRLKKPLACQQKAKGGTSAQSTEAAQHATSCTCWFPIARGEDARSK